MNHLNFTLGISLVAFVFWFVTGIMYAPKQDNGKEYPTGFVFLGAFLLTLLTLAFAWGIRLLCI